MDVSGTVFVASSNGSCPIFLGFITSVNSILVLFVAASGTRAFSRHARGAHTHGGMSKSASAFIAQANRKQQLIIESNSSTSSGVIAEVVIFCNSLESASIGRRFETCCYMHNAIFKLHSKPLRVRRTLRAGATHAIIAAA